VVPASEVRYTGGNRFYPLPTDPAPTVRLAAPSPSAGPADTGPLPAHHLAGATASNPGVLNRAGRAIESQRTYVLMTSQGHLYATAQPGLDPNLLEQYVGARVQLFGTTSYHKELRAYCMTVTNVQVLP
jgi:hypothetical protein